MENSHKAIRFLKWYEIRTKGLENIPADGPAVLLSNRVHPCEGLFLERALGRRVYFVVSPEEKTELYSHPLTREMNLISAEKRGDDPKAIIREIVDRLGKGNCVAIFIEEGANHDNLPVVLRRDLAALLEACTAPFIPLYIDPIGSPVLASDEKGFTVRKPSITPWIKPVLAGPAATASMGIIDIRNAITEMGIEAARIRRRTDDLLHLRFIRVAKSLWNSFCMADSTGKQLTYGKTLIASILLAQLIRKKCPDERMIGIMLPPVVGSALANIGALMAGKLPVNLNFLSGEEAINSAISQCGIKSILTSRKFLEKLSMPARNEMVFLEDLLQQVSLPAKLWAALRAKLYSSGALCRMYNWERWTPDDLVTVIFSSGTTGLPKGVMLSHQNILANVESFVAAVAPHSRDRIMAILPHFHSFGFTCTIWFPVIAGMGVIYHPNPMDAKAVGDLVQKFGATILVGTPTFFGAYVRKCPEEQFKSLRYAIVGAEKLRESIRRNFVEKYGMELLEGYGCTEMAPVVSTNVVDALRRPEYQTGHKPGTIGYPVPGVAARIMNPESGELLPPGAEGVLLLNGPNRMLGYLNQPERTAEVLKDGWYITGDMASIDEDGFIRITDRISRFSKIGGEMVPHGRIEDEVSAILDGYPCAVTAALDERKGERLVVLYSREEIRPLDIWERLSRSSLPKLWIPRRDDIYLVPEIPVIGTGKMDLRKVKELAVALIEAKSVKSAGKMATDSGK